MENFAKHARRISLDFYLLLWFGWHTEEKYNRIGSREYKAIVEIKLAFQSYSSRAGHLEVSVRYSYTKFYLLES